MNPWHNDELFLYTLEDMRRCLSSKSLFDQLFLAVHLRKLLLDSPTLVSAVNRWQLKIRFEVVRDPFLEVDYEKINEPYASTALSMSRHTPHLYPKRRTKKKAVSLALDAFLTVRTTRLGGIITQLRTLSLCARTSMVLFTSMRRLANLAYVGDQSLGHANADSTLQTGFQSCEVFPTQSWMYQFSCRLQRSR